MKRDPRQPPETEVVLLTAPQAAQKMQVRVRELRDMINAGEQPVKRFRKAIRIHSKTLRTKGAAGQTNAANGSKAVSAETEVVLLTVRQAARKTQVCERTLREMIKAEELPFKRFRNTIRIHPKDLGL